MGMAPVAAKNLDVIDAKYMMRPPLAAATE
jgi:hypothetical protein